MPPSRVEIIRNGKPGTAMVGFATVLKPDELAAIEAYIHTLAHGAGVSWFVRANPDKRSHAASY